jgi:RNA polymerase sigma factor (sigma-70 family)
MNPMNEDAHLLRKFAETQDQGAFTDIVQRHIGFVYAVALRRMRDVHSAEDVTQAVFVALARKAATVAACPSVIGWLHRSAYFESRNIMRAAINRTSRELEAQRRGHVQTEKSADTNWETIRAVLDDALQELPDKDREAVLSRFFAGESYTEVGVRLRLSENAARMRVERALARLHECLIRRGLTSTSAALASALPVYASVTVPAGLVASITNAAITGITLATAPVGVFAFMSATKIAVVAGVFGALGIVAALHQANVAQESKSALAAIAVERDTLRARLLSADRAPNESKASSIPTRNDAETQRNVSSTAIEHDVTAATPTKAWQTISPVNQAFESPETRDAFVTQEVLRAEAKFRRFFATAGLSAAQEAALRAQFRSLSEAMVEYYLLVRNQGFGPMNPPQNPKVLAELLRMENDILTGFSSGVRGVLGDARYQEFAADWKTIRERNVSEELAGRLYYTGTPLTDFHPVANKHIERGGIR